MGQRNKQHMGRSVDDQRDLVGRDVQAGDATAERAARNQIPMPNEEGTGFESDRVGGAAQDMEADDLRQGGSGSREGSA